MGATAAVADRPGRARGRAAVLHHRRPHARAPWSGASVRSEFRRLATRARVRRRFAPHQPRHAHALEMAREGVPLNIIQRELGHANLGHDLDLPAGDRRREDDRRPSTCARADDVPQPRLDSERHPAGAHPRARCAAASVHSAKSRRAVLVRATVRGTRTTRSLSGRKRSAVRGEGPSWRRSHAWNAIARDGAAPFASLRQRRCLSSHRWRARRPRRRAYAPGAMRRAGVALPLLSAAGISSARRNARSVARRGRRLWPLPQYDARPPARWTRWVRDRHPRRPASCHER